MSQAPYAKFDEMEPETPIGLPSLGKRGWIGIPIMLGLLALVVSMVSAGIANAADGSTRTIILEQVHREYDSTVEAEIFDTGRCSIGVQGYASQGVVTLWHVMDNGGWSERERTTIQHDGDVVVLDEVYPPSPSHGFHFILTWTGFDDTALRVVIDSALVVNTGNC